MTLVPRLREAVARRARRLPAVTRLLAKYRKHRYENRIEEFVQKKDGRAGDLPAGETINAWIPFPRHIPGQQDDIKLVGSVPAKGDLAPESALMDSFAEEMGENLFIFNKSMFANRSKPGSPNPQIDDASPENLKALQRFFEEILEENQTKFDNLCLWRGQTGRFP